MEWPAYVEGAELCLFAGYRQCPQDTLLGLHVSPLCTLLQGQAYPALVGAGKVSPAFLEMGSVLLKTGLERTELDFVVLDACFHLGEKLLLASTGCSLPAWWSWAGNWPAQKISTPQPSHFLAWGDHAHTSVVVGRTGQGLGAIPRDTLLGKKEGGFWAPWVLECREFQVKWTYRASCQLHFKLFSFDILVVSSVFQSWV